MNAQLRIKNIVIIGNFDIINFDKYFFIKNDIISESDILAGSRFDSLSAQIITPNFDIVLNIGHIILSSKILVGQNESINKVAIKLIQDGNLNDITGMGINFHWFLDNLKEDLSVTTKQLFYNQNSSLFSTFFTSDDSMFGLYASKNYENARLKLDIKPYRSIEFAIAEKTQSDTIIFIFNFHFDLKNIKDVSIEKILNDYNLYFDESSKIMCTY